MNQTSTNGQNAKPKFTLGQVVATPGALALLRESRQSPMEFLSKHVAGEWGELDGDDKQLNDEAVIDGGRILSAYRTSTNQKLWIITEAKDEQGHRAATTLLLPEEY